MKTFHWMFWLRIPTCTLVLISPTCVAGRPRSPLRRMHRSFRYPRFTLPTHWDRARRQIPLSHCKCIICSIDCLMKGPICPDHHRPYFGQSSSSSAPPSSSYPSPTSSPSRSPRLTSSALLRLGNNRRLKPFAPCGRSNIIQPTPRSYNHSCCASLSYVACL